MLIRDSHSWIVCTECKTPIKDSQGGVCKCGNIKSSVDKDGIVTTVAQDGEKIIYDTE
mgnify:FL=1